MITINSECSTQWFVPFFFFHVWIIVIASIIIMLAWLKDNEERKSEYRRFAHFGDLLSSEGNVPVAHGSTW